MRALTAQFIVRARAIGWPPRAEQRGNGPVREKQLVVSGPGSRTIPP